MMQSLGRDAQCTNADADADAPAVAAALRGDPGAFEHLYRTHAARIHALAQRFLGPELADDGTQEVFLRLWERLDDFRGDAAFATWLHRVAVTVLLRQAQVLRRASSRTLSYDADGEGAGALAGYRTDSRETRTIGEGGDIDRALATLSDGLRAVVVLHDLEGWLHDAIGDHLGISVSASRVRLHRARLHLRELLLR
ncbi:MAG: polymerase sigma factor, sigma-70 family [Gemmatimonadetes bacterium]|nr:polymerase sigma factor, sigma-70 family [Gemmatimonadota bacterium]